jgi:putative colanic acid biosynthesis glycosyltransferase WcaI
MRILLLNQFFWPDAARTGELLADLAQRLVDDGCSVTVVCGRSPYVQTRQTEMASVQVLRAPVLPFRKGISARVLSYFSYLLLALWHSFRQARPDIVVTLTTPPLLSVIGALAKRLRGCRHIIWEMDVYPDVAVDLGVLRPDSWLTRVLTAIANTARRRADGIIVLGNCMRQRLIDQGISAEKIHVVENWADGELIRARAPKSRNGTLSVLYSGNLGRAHDVETICAVMEKLKDDERFHFTFAGFGGRRPGLQDFCTRRGIPNVSFQPYCEREELGDVLAGADIGLVTQRAECLGALVPSKIYGLMAAARPILFIGPRKSTADQVLSRHDCGWQVDCGDADSVVNLLLNFAEFPDVLRHAGERGHKAFLHEYDRHIGTARIAAILGVALPARARAVAASAASNGKNGHFAPSNGNGHINGIPKKPNGHVGTGRVWQSKSES